jgi:hypothetical protein
MFQVTQLGKLTQEDILRFLGNTAPLARLDSVSVQGAESPAYQAGQETREGNPGDQDGGPLQDTMN